MGLFSRNQKSSAPLLKTGQLTVLAVTNDTATVEPIFSSLLKFQCHSRCVHEVHEFIGALESMTPDVILFSLNLKNTDAMKVIIILQDLHLPCIVFGERADEQTLETLLGTEIRHALLPPLNFETFMERVELLAMEKEMSSHASGKAPLIQDWGTVLNLLKNQILGSDKIIFHERPSIETGTAYLIDLTPLEEQDLKIGTVLKMDVFIAMPLNHKCILYLRKGTKIFKETLDHLSRYDKSRVLKYRSSF